MGRKIKNMVVALDLSEYAAPVLDYAIDMAKRIGASLTIIHIINKKAIDCLKRQFETDHLEYFPYREYISREKKRCLTSLEAIVKEREPGDVPITIMIEEGIPSQEIIRFLRKGDSDFLVMGQRGESNLPDFLSGTVAEKVFRHSPVPVLGLRLHQGARSK